VTTTLSDGLAAQVEELSVAGQAENVTTRVFRLVGFHTVLHHTATFSEVVPSVTESADDEPVPQHGSGGLAFQVSPVANSGV
jgi:hypothetical protein